MKIRLNTQYVYSFTVAYMLSFLGILSMTNNILNTVGLQTTLDTIVMYSALLFLVFGGLLLTFTEGETFKVDVFIIVAFFVMAFIASSLFHPENSVYMFTSIGDYSGNPIYLFFIYSLPCYIFVRYLKNYSYFIRIMRAFSYVTVVMAIIVFFFTKGTSVLNYMTFSYNMLLQLFFLIVYRPGKKYMLPHYAVVGLGIIALVFGGSRGAMVFLLAGCVIFYLFTNKLSIKSISVIVLATLAVILVAMFKENILVLSAEFMESLSIDSRNLRYLMEGNLFDTKSRNGTYTDAIANMGVLGKGLMGDRIVLDIYAHNIFLELLVQFGIVAGFILCVALIAFLVSSLLKKDKPELVFILLLLPCGLFKLLVTGSYLHQEPAFYALLAFCMSSHVRRSELCG